MRSPIVPRRAFDHAGSERDEWRRRADRALDATIGRPVELSAARGWARLSRVLVAAWMLALGFALGGVLVTRPAGESRPDYPGCIGRARYEHPIAGNQYQELVNALYACSVYVPASSG